MDPDSAKRLSTRFSFSLARASLTSVSLSPRVAALFNPLVSAVTSFLCRFGWVTTAAFQPSVSAAPRDETRPVVSDSEQRSRKANEACVIKDQNARAVPRGETRVILISFMKGSSEGLTQQGTGLKSHLIRLTGKARAPLRAAERFRRFQPALDPYKVFGEKTDGRVRE